MKYKVFERLFQVSTRIQQNSFEFFLEFFMQVVSIYDVAQNDKEKENQSEEWKCLS